MSCPLVQQTVLFVGYGYMGRTHGLTIRKIITYKVVGVVEININNQNIFKKDYPNVLCFSNFIEALEETKPQIIILSTGVEFHSIYTQKAFSYGAHVFVEKPLTFKRNDYQKIVKAQIKNHRWFKIGYILREHPSFKIYLKKIKQYFKETPFVWEINLTQYKIKKECNLYFKKNIPVLDCGIHYLDMLLRVCDEWSLDTTFSRWKENKNELFYEGFFEIKISLKSIFRFSLRVEIGEKKQSMLHSKIDNVQQQLVLKSNAQYLLFHHDLWFYQKNESPKKIEVPLDPSRLSLNELQHLKFLEELQKFDLGILKENKHGSNDLEMLKIQLMEKVFV